MKSLEELLEPVSEDSPSGEDIEDSLDFDNLYPAFDDNFPIDAGVTELADGDAPPPPVDWEETLEKIEELSGQTKHLFLAVSYARCGFCIGDPEVVDRGLKFAAGLVEDFWDSVHPAIDGPLGFAGRSAIFEGIARRGAFALPFYELPIIVSDRLNVKAGQILDAEEHGASSDGYPMVMQALDQMDDERKQEIADLLESYIASIDRIDAALKAHADGDLPDFSTVKDIIGMVQTAFGKLAGLVSDEDAEAGEDAGSGELADAGAGGPALSGTIKSRDDVIKALSAIEQYYARAEPGHPVKVSIARLRGWVTKDFMEILADIVPNSVDDAENVLLERRDME